MEGRVKDTYNDREDKQTSAEGSRNIEPARGAAWRAPASYYIVLPWDSKNLFFSYVFATRIRRFLKRTNARLRDRSDHMSRNGHLPRLKRGLS